MWSGDQKNSQKSSRKEEIWPKIMFLDPKEVSKPKMSLIEVVRRPKIDFGTKLQVVWSMYEVRNQKNVRKSSCKEEIWPKLMILTPRRSPSQKSHHLEPVTYEINPSFCSKAGFKDVTHPLVTWANIFNFWAKLYISDWSRASPPTNSATLLGCRQQVSLYSTRLGHRRGPKAPV